MNAPDSNDIQRSEGAVELRVASDDGLAETRRSRRRQGAERLTPARIHDAPAFSEEAIALSFADQHANDLRFIDKWGKWFVWDGVLFGAKTTRSGLLTWCGWCAETRPRRAKSRVTPRRSRARRRLLL